MNFILKRLIRNLSGNLLICFPYNEYGLIKVQIYGIKMDSAIQGINLKTSFILVYSFNNDR